MIGNTSIKHVDKGQTTHMDWPILKQRHCIQKIIRREKENETGKEKKKKKRGRGRERDTCVGHVAY